MEKKLTKKDQQLLETAAMIDAALIDVLTFLLSGDRRHDAQMRATLTIYAGSLPGTYLNGIEDSGIWDTYLGDAFALFLDQADKRLPGFRKDVELSIKRRNTQKKDNGESASQQ